MKAQVRYEGSLSTWWPVEATYYEGSVRLTGFAKEGTVTGVVVDAENAGLFAWTCRRVVGIGLNCYLDVPLETAQLVRALLDRAEMERTLTRAQEAGTELRDERDQYRTRFEALEKRLLQFVKDCEKAAGAIVDAHTALDEVGAPETASGLSLVERIRAMHAAQSKVEN